MTVYQWLCLLGVPSLIVAGFTAMIKYLHKRIANNDKETKAVGLGVQALLRGQMINDYNKWSERGYAPIYARENFENMYTQYHALGGNGVMTDMHNKFMALPIKEN